MALKKRFGSSADWTWLLVMQNGFDCSQILTPFTWKRLALIIDQSLLAWTIRGGGEQVGSCLIKGGVRNQGYKMWWAEDGV